LWAFVIRSKMKGLTDVLILGAGIVGCAIADELSRRGARVTVADPRGISKGASQASAGMLAPFTEGLHDPVLEALGAQSLELFDALIERLQADGHDLVYGRGGSIDVALDGATAAVLAARAGDLSKAGIAHRLLDAAEARHVEPSLAPDTTAALTIDAHGFVGVPQLAAALWGSAESRGGGLVAEAVRRIVPGHGTVRVELETTTRDALYVVLATGCWTGRIDLAGAPPLPVRPVRGQLLVLRWPDGDVPRRTLWGPRCYAVPWPDGTLLVGATVEEAGFDERATVAGVHDLLAAVSELIPRAWNASMSSVRVGLRPATTDDRPIIGASRRIEGLVYATGHYRNGVLLAPITARIVADIIEGKAVDGTLDACAPGRFGEY
jgi:glycine oxidase